MKWINHELLTGVTIYAFTEDSMLAVLGMAGAILPDKLEGKPGEGSSYWSWRSRHRGWSHWPVPYMLAAVGVLILCRDGMAAASARDFSTILLFIVLGALLHILQDSICGKVPFIVPWNKHGIKLFAVGSFSEYLFTIAYILMVYILYCAFVT